jgi:hypothetical protein
MLRDRRMDIAILAVIVAFFFCFFWQALFTGRVFLAGDQLVYSYPLRTIAWDMIRHGQLPLWTPYVFSGYPLLSMAQLGLGYPLTWGYLFLPGHWAENVVMVAPYVLAPTFTYLYLRELGRSRPASLLGGFSFGYGGLMLSGIGLNGMLSNATAWTPLLLLAVERARTRTFAKCLLLAAGAYAMAVLSGIGQGFVYAGGLAIAYAVFVVICWPRADDGKSAPRLNSFARWRPLAVIVIGMLLAAGVAAFQILETRQAQRLSVRRKLTYEQFSDGAFRFSMAWKSWLDPFHISGDVSAYVPPLVVLLAVVSVWAAVWQKPRERRVFFWLAVAIIAWLLMCGPHTPVFKWAFRIPFLNLFRVPSRHVFEWTLAASIMAAYGWDAVGSRWRRRTLAAPRRSTLGYANAIFWAVASLVVGIAWYRACKKLIPEYDPQLEVLSYPYLGWKLAFVVITTIALWSAWRIGQQRVGSALLLLTIAILCFFEPFSFVAIQAPHYGVFTSRLTYRAPTTNFVQQFPPEQNRVYSQFSMETDGESPQPRVDLPNIPVLSGLHNVAGFEPLMLERYSRALNSTTWDEVNRGPSLGGDPSLFEAPSQVLDLLNTRFVISYAGFAFNSSTLIEREGIAFDNSFTIGDLNTDSPTTLPAFQADADTLAVVSIMARSNHIADETPVARITIHTTDGQVIERLLRAGSDTSEWAYERPDVKATIRHRRAPVFDSRPSDDQSGYPALRYWARISLGDRLRVGRVEMTKLVADADVGIWHASLFDSKTQTSTQLHPFDPKRWEIVYDKDGMWVTRNNRALPRAWLVTEAEALNSKQIWRRIRGLSGNLDDRPFDPRRTALIEIEPNKLPQLTGRALSPDSYARVVSYKPNQLIIETNSDQQTVLVISEIHYPGWVATLDGAKTPIHQTDFLLRGVVVPAGKHRVEMSYRAPQARNGAIISLLTLGLIGWVALRARRQSRARPNSENQAK